MDPTTLQQIAEWAGGNLIGPGDRTVTIVSTDSRTLKAGELFVALRGEHFDGHDFIPGAATLGAAGAVVEEAPPGLPEGFTLIVVKDTLAALQRLASNYRETLPARVVGITGSNGKTSTKDFMAAILSKKFRTFKTEGNLNNHIGVPMTLLRASREHEAGVVETGTNHPGEIAPLARMAKPAAAIVTNIGMAHIEFLGSREGIATEKAALAESVPAEGVVALGLDNEFIDLIRSRTNAHVVLTGIGAGEVSAENVQVREDGTAFTVHADGQTLEAFIPVPGEHMVRNALLAIAIGLRFGISLEDCIAGLRASKLTKGRVEQKVIGGIHIVDDSYNASPDSMVAALATVAKIETAGRRIAVLGRMLELGEQAERGHRLVGEAVAQQRFDALVAIGQEATWIVESARKAGLSDAWALASHEQATAHLLELAKPGDLVLVKGSRGARMEKVIEGLQSAYSGSTKEESL